MEELKITLKMVSILWSLKEFCRTVGEERSCLKLIVISMACSGKLARSRNRFVFVSRSLLRPESESYGELARDRACPIPFIETVFQIMYTVILVQNVAVLEELSSRP